MNAAVTAALLAAQQSQLPNPIDRLTKAGAVNSSKATTLEPANAAEAKLIDQGIAQGLIQRRADGRLFVNTRAVAERNSRIGYQLGIGVLVTVSILASVLALVIFVAR
jgi:S1-C subfamily serine protease